jgi:hypothetical protein
MVSSHRHEQYEHVRQSIVRIRAPLPSTSFPVHHSLSPSSDALWVTEKASLNGEKVRICKEAVVLTRRMSGETHEHLVRYSKPIALVYGVTAALTYLVSDGAFRRQSEIDKGRASLLVACWASGLCEINPLLWTVIILAYFPKMKVGLSNHQSVCVSATNNFWTAW